MVRILNWNCRGLNKPKRKTLLKNYLLKKKIDLVGIQETKIMDFAQRTLDFLSTNIDIWIFKPSISKSRGLLMEINSSIYFITQQWIFDFSITVLLFNKNDSFQWTSSCFPTITLFTRIRIYSTFRF
jgi:hypothetical protein